MKIIELKSGEDLNGAVKNAGAAEEEEILIKMAPGKYQGPVTVDRGNLTIEGTDPLTTVITGKLAAFEIMEDGQKRGTFRTQTLFIDADNVRLKNLTVENTAGDGDKVGQAIALYADGDCLEFENCRFLGHQDTLFTAPLPEKEVEPGGFRGPKEKAPRRKGRQYYRDCYIEGDVDFIFGGATAFFENCEIHSLKREMGYVTAASTPEDSEFGYVFYKCRFSSDAEEGSSYLGRPWREHAKTVLIECEIGRHIAKEGWYDWNGRASSGTVYYAEYGSTREGAYDNDIRDFAYKLTEEEAKKYNKTSVLGKR